MKCLFIPLPDLCPRDIGTKVKNYFPLSKVDTIVTRNRDILNYYGHGLVGITFVFHVFWTPSHELIVGWRKRFAHITGPSSNPDGLV